MAIDPLALSSAEISAPATQPNTPLAARADLPAHFARQLVEVAQHLPARPVEITLSPEELGRIRLSVSPSEHSIVVHILAERPETADLLRRHIDQLAQEFQDLGYDDIAFSFSGADQNTSDTKDEDTSGETARRVTSPERDDTAPTTHIDLATGATTGLDLRL